MSLNSFFKIIKYYQFKNALNLLLVSNLIIKITPERTLINVPIINKTLAPGQCINLKRPPTRVIKKAKINNERRCFIFIRL